MLKKKITNFNPFTNSQQNKTKTSRINVIEM